MLETLIAVLLILWLAGLLTHVVFGGALHILLLAALVILVIRLAQGRRIL